MCREKYIRFLILFVLVCILKWPMACITLSIDFLYLGKTSWCCWIIFIKENLIVLICPFYLNTWLFISTRKIFNFTGYSKTSKKLCSNVLLEYFDKDIGAVIFDFICVSLCFEMAYGLYHSLNQFFIFRKNLLVLLDHFY